VTAPAKRPNQLLTLFALVTASSAYALSQTLVTPALPLFQRELHTTATMVTFLLTAYLLAASVATPIAGRLGDMFGKKRLLVAVLGLFAAGSLLAALSSTIELMIVARVIQGASAAIFPLSYGIIRDEFPRERMSTGIGLISATFGIGGGVGLILSGLIVDHLSYHWLYWASLIVVLASLTATVAWVPESPIKTPAKVDWTGAALLSAGLTAALVAISEGNKWGWLSMRIVWLLALGLILLAVLAWFEPRHPQPLADMRMLAQRAVLTPNLTGFLVGFGMFGGFILIPQFVQIPTAAGFGFGASVTKAGVFMLPSTVAMLLSGAAAGWMCQRISSKFVLLLGTSSLTVSFVFLAALHHDEWSIYVGSGLIGAGLGFSYAAMANLIIEAVPQTQTGAATGINTIMRTIGGTLGGQIAASIIAARMAPTGLPRESGFTAAFAMFGIALVLATVAAIAIPAARKAQAADLVVPAVGAATVPDPVAELHLIDGVVHTADGDPLPGALVVLLDEHGVAVQQTVTDGSGRYRITGIRRGRHSVVVIADGHHPDASDIVVPHPVEPLLVLDRRDEPAVAAGAARMPATFGW
jgi:EmrB/QacA subfamily drug resistance transporter